MRLNDTMSIVRWFNYNLHSKIIIHPVIGILSEKLSTIKNQRSHCANRFDVIYQHAMFITIICITTNLIDYGSFICMHFNNKFTTIKKKTPLNSTQRKCISNQLNSIRKLFIIGSSIIIGILIGAFVFCFKSSKLKLIIFNQPQIQRRI